MSARLCYLDPDAFSLPPDWTAVGFIAPGEPLAFDPARRPHRLTDTGPEPLDPSAVAAALAPAIEAAALRLWPDGWTHALADMFKVHRRSLARDRLASVTLPPAVLQVLGLAASTEDADGMGRILSAMVWYAETHGEGSAWVDRVASAAHATENARHLLLQARRGKPLRPEPEPEG